MGAEENKAVVERFLNEVGRGQVDIVDQLCDEAIVNHAAVPERQRGIENLKAVLTFSLTAQPDQR